MLDRMLGLLASFDIVKCTVEKKENLVRRYGPAPIFKWLVKNEDGTTVADLVHLGMEQAFISGGYVLDTSSFNSLFLFSFFSQLYSNFSTKKKRKKKAEGQI